MATVQLLKLKCIFQEHSIQYQSDNDEMCEGMLCFLIIIAINTFVT